MRSQTAMTSPSFYTRAGNFLSAAQGSVDPRTGLFNASLSLLNLRAGDLSGPALALTLGYSPLSPADDGFGRGFSLNLTRYDTVSQRLMLSSGEQYSVSSGGTVIRQKKFRNVIFKKVDDKNYQVIHKSGLTEYLSRFGSVFVPVRIAGADSRSIRFSWAEQENRMRLVKAWDDNAVVLCEADYSAEKEGTTTLTVLPGDTVSGYTITFTLTGTMLTRVVSSAGDTPLAWRLEYSPVISNRLLTGITSPEGGRETVAYHATRQMGFPDAAGPFPSLPCVEKHSLIPGAGQPDIVTVWEWTENNHLGKNAAHPSWDKDTDPMLHALKPDYFYGSVARVRDTGTGYSLSETTRRYNGYHLLVSESTLRNGKRHTLSTEYHAQPGGTFNEQPEHFMLPTTVRETWSDSTGVRKSMTQYQFDASGNLLWHHAPDGTVTTYAYYPAGGEGDACPADPYGFTRYLKAESVVFPRIVGDEDSVVAVHTWKKRNDLTSEGYTVVPDSVTRWTGSMKSTVTRAYHDDPADSLTYGREKTRTTVFTPDTQTGTSYTRRQNFTYARTAEGIRQTETLTTHDGFSVTRATLRHPQLGHLLSETDVQGVTVTHTYDRAARPLTRTVAQDTPYAQKTTWSYDTDSGGPVTTETGPDGNRTRVYHDALGREIRRQRQDTDGAQAWRDVATRSYTCLGEADKGSGSDWLPSGEETYRMEAAFAYDGWGMLRAEGFSDGTVRLQTTAPVSLRQTAYRRGMKDGEKQVSGRTVTVHDARSTLPVTVTRQDRSGAETGGTVGYEWDGTGRLCTQTGVLGDKTRFMYDALGRMLSQTLPDGTVITRTYAPHLTGPQVASISVTGEDGSGNKETLLLGTQAFDGLGRLTKCITGGRTTTYAYEGASPVPSVITGPSGRQTEFTYIPELGNAVSSITAGGVKQTFTWSATAGRMLTAAEGGTETENVLFPSGALKTERVTQGGTTREAGYTRTLSGAVESYTDVTGKTTRYVRDGTGRLTGITDDALTVSLEYSPLGYLSRQVVTDVKTQATLTTALTYDDFGRETGRTLTDSSGTGIVISQTWLKNDLLATRTTQKGGVPVREEVFTYDTLCRLTGYTVTGDSLPADAYGQPITTQSYRYDALNNLNTVTTGLNDSAGSTDVATYYYDNADDPTQLTSVTHTLTGTYPADIQLEYDADGRMTKDESGRTRGYDATGRLVSVSGASTGAGTYGYDALNQLVSQAISATDVRQLYYRGGELVSETHQQSQKTNRWVKNGHTCLGVSDRNSTTLTSGDQHDSLQWSRDPSQKVGVQHGWSPYGGGQSSGGLPGFNGERCDPVTGNYPLGNGYRTYSPALMRFTCPDSLSPFGAGGINPYAYCAGDPVNHTDPSGHLSWQAWVGIGLGTAGLLLAGVTAGMSVAAAGGIIAAISATSTTTLVAGGLGVAADVTGIASGALEESHPEASGALGYISMATGAGALGAGIKGLMAAGRGAARSVASAGEALEMQPLLGGAGRVSETGFKDLPEEMIREIGSYLPRRDLINFSLANKRISNIIGEDLARVRSVESYQTALTRRETRGAFGVMNRDFSNGLTTRLFRLNDYLALNGKNFAARRAISFLRRDISAFESNVDGFIDFRFHCARYARHPFDEIVRFRVYGEYDGFYEDVAMNLNRHLRARSLNRFCILI